MIYLITPIETLIEDAILFFAFYVIRRPVRAWQTAKMDSAHPNCVKSTIRTLLTRNAMYSFILHNFQKSDQSILSDRKEPVKSTLFCVV